MGSLDFLLNDARRLRELLLGARTVAVVGLSSDPSRASHGVASMLLRYGFEIYPVNPNEESALGRAALPALANVPVPIDIVDLFRRSELVGPHIDEAITVGAKAVWMQDGVFDQQAAKRAHAAGLTVVMDRCMARDLVGLFGPPPLPSR